MTEKGEGKGKVEGGKGKGKGKAKKRPPAGLAAFTESGTVPRRVTLARIFMILGYAAALPVVLGVEDGRRLFWAAAIASLPLFWVLGGYHLWRRVCPLAVFSQLGRLVGRPGTRRVSGWLSRGYPLVQLGIMVAALSLRLVMTNGTPWALAGFVAFATIAAAAVGFVYTGKTWCNYLCPVGVVEKIYTEPSRLSGPRDSKCSPCTACKKHCPDIDLEQGYWKEVMLPSRRIAYFAWPGIVFGFYLYFYLVAGNWDYYFSGAWTLEDHQIEQCLKPGLFFLDSLPIAVAAPLTLLFCGAVSFSVFAAGERLAARFAARDQGEQAVRHRSLALAGFTAFLVFYFYGGQPTIRLLPTWFGRLFSVAVVISASAIFFRRWRRSEADFVEERFAEKILKRWEWGDEPPADRIQDIVVIHTERTKERKARVSAYKDAVREMVADGIVTRGEIAVLDRLRAQLGITDKEHKKALDELGEEERQLFDPEYQGSIEQRMQKEAHQRDLERVVIAAARAGAPPDPETLETLRREHGVSLKAQEEALAALLADDGPVAGLYEEQLQEIEALGRAHRAAGGEEGESSASLEYLRYVCRWRARRRAELALDLLAPLGGVAVGERIRTDLVADSDEARARGRAALIETVGEERAEALADRLESFQDVGDALAPEPLLVLLDESSPYLRAAAVHVLSRFDDDRSREAVLGAASDPEALVRETAYHALGVRGRIRRDLMSRAVRDPDPRVRAAAVNAVAGRQSGRSPAVDTQAALAAAENEQSRGVVATLDPQARIESLTSLEKMMFLRRVPMLAGLEPDDLEEVSLLAQERRFAPDQALCREGEEGREVFLIVSGTVEAWTGSGTERRVLGRSGPGACIGEMAVLDAAPRAATVTAVELTRTLVLSADDFHALLFSRPAIGESIIGVLVSRLRGMIAAG